VERAGAASPPDAEGNVAIGELIQVDAARNIVVDARTKQRSPIALVGQRDTILVLTDDAVLVVHKSQSQKLKELVKKLADDKQFRALT
jgi:hypothetical protein